MYAGTTRKRVPTCARCAGTHGDVLNVHTEFSACHTSHTTPQHTTQHTTTHHNTPQQHDHNTSRKQRQRETETDRERRRRQREEKREERRSDTRREKIHFQCGGAWPFLVDVVLCLVHPVNDRVFSLLNGVKYDCSVFSFSASWPVNSFFISANCLIRAVTVFNFPKLFSGAATVFLPELILHKYSVEGCESEKGD